jgi:hypothetical protein
MPRTVPSGKQENSVTVLMYEARRCAKFFFPQGVGESEGVIKEFPRVGHKLLSDGVSGGRAGKGRKMGCDREEQPSRLFAVPDKSSFIGAYGRCQGGGQVFDRPN